jgi:alkylhydroperoxidase/carboxymuconolactone decarboxylase family protein YurZ
MAIERMLARGGLDARLRTMVGAAVAIWRGDWSALRAWAAAARDRGQARADLEETLLQAVLFCGFPRTVTAFEQLADVWPTPRPPGGGALPPDQQSSAGRQLFATIYGANTDAVEAMLRSFHADFHAFVFDVAYGRILTRPHLTAREREVIAVALLAAQDQPRQFAGHARGALHCGASRDELREALVTALGDEAAVTPWLQRVR